ncbi:response regulator transcription factor [Paenibacillus hunanensis]|uniref:response regulator transcription factor n=1 Tax=Paenibacillus hunanensis TaxID=539262 RepID=UPI002A6A0CB8|nr:response regulator transcription factor [Paenibacillus hunanensis]WPP43276.1 response regulator transcription factor [Paenibacillus hunanensis]
MSTRVLIADDEAAIRNSIAYALKREHFTVETATDGRDALARVEQFRPDVLVLDVMMPEMDGYEVCRRLEQRRGLGIVLLTARDDVIDRVLGLELGADDYVAKPFDIRELIARIKALARRVDRENAPPPLDEPRTLGPLTVQPASREARIDGQSLELTPKEFDLLLLLATHPGRVYTRDELLELVWGMDYLGETRTVDIHIQRLRKKLDPHQSLLQTVYGIGYRSEPQA